MKKPLSTIFVQFQNGKIIHESVTVIKCWSLSHFLDVCMTRRYTITSLLLLVMMISHSFYGNWVWDFWEHSAVVKELSTHPIHPQHPLLKVDKAHPFFSPYLLFIGLLSRFASLTPITALAIAGVLNLLLLLISLRLFIHCFFNKHQDAIGFYALIFILFLWPAQAWNWSGFIHFSVLGYVLPYPSTFAIAITFLIFSIYYKALHSMSKIKLLLCGVFTTLVILTHPTTAVFTVLGLFSITLQQFKCIGLRALFTGLFILIGAVSLVCLWPYYSFWDLIKANNPEFHTSSYIMYKEIFMCFWPNLLLSPFALTLLISRLRRNKFDALMLMFCSAVIVYIVAYFTGLYGVGRIILFVAIIIQVVLGVQMARLESKKKMDKSWYTVLVIIIIVGLVACFNSRGALKRVFNGFRGLKCSYIDYEFLGRYTNQYDVILADLKTSWQIPTFGGKVIASLHPIHWIDDHLERRHDIQRFFSKEEKMTEKLAIINRYKVDYILINKKKLKDVEAYINFGTLVYVNKAFILIDCSDKRSYLNNLNVIIEDQ
jgi:hypothetical protein